MLSIKDVVSLAKAGYKPADVKELIELSKEPEEKKPEQPAPEEKKPEQPAPEEKEPEIDYKAKYNELLEANRKAALTRDNSGNEPQQKSAEEIVNEALIGLLS
jgi:hypothetical protein